MSWKIHAVPFDGFDGFAHPLDEAARRLLNKEAQLKRAKRCMAATGPALRAARRAISEFPNVQKSRLGIITTGGAVHTEHCLRFLERAVMGAPHLVNPQDFPHTLVSAQATTIAEAVGAHACAFTVGEDELAVIELLHTAYDLLTAGVAELILAVFSSSSDGVAKLAADRGVLVRYPADCAIVLALSLNNVDGSIEISGSREQNDYSIVYENGSLDAPKDSRFPSIEDLWFGPALGGYLLKLCADFLARQELSSTERMLLAIRAGRGTACMSVAKTIF